MSPVTAGTAGVALALVVASSVCGCGESALRRQARAADAVGLVVNEAGSVIRDSRRQAQQEAANGAEYREDAREAVEGVRARYAPLLASYEAVAVAHDLWVETLLLAAAGNISDPERWVRLAMSTLDAWARLAAASAAVGLSLPSLPSLRIGGDQ